MYTRLSFICSTAVAGGVVSMVGMYNKYWKCDYLQSLRYQIRNITNKSLILHDAEPPEVGFNLDSRLGSRLGLLGATTR